MQHGRDFCAGGGAFRVKEIVFPAVQNTVSNRPFHGFLRPCGQVALIGEAVKASCNRHVAVLVLRVAVED